MNLSFLFEIQVYHYIFLSLGLFTLGVFIVLLRKNLIVIFMGIELMLNGVNLSLVAFSSFYGNSQGVLMAFFVMTIAACEAAVGLAILVHIYKYFKSLNLDQFKGLKQ